MLQQNVVAGKTPVGTQVQAKLTVATLLNGKVIPRNAVLSGEVVASAAKTSSEPSRLAIRMDSARWKNDSVSIKIYLTVWFYPLRPDNGPDLQYGPEQPANKTWNGMGQYPDPNSPAYRPFPAGGSDKSPSFPDTPSSVTSNHRVRMREVESERSTDGSIALISHHSNIKLDKITTYVMASGELMPLSKSK